MSSEGAADFGQCGGSPGDGFALQQGWELRGRVLYRSDRYDMWHNVAIPPGIVNHFL
jgi:hypothetical protein